MGILIPNSTEQLNEDPVDHESGTQHQGEAGGSQSEEAGKRKLTLEEATAELERARREAAKYRTERNNLQPLAEKYREQEEANKTVEQKSAERIAELEKQNQELTLARFRVDAAATAGINAELLRGNTEEEITAHAEAIKAATDSAVEKALKDAGLSGTGPVVPGENAGKAPIVESDWLRSAFNSR